MGKTIKRKSKARRFCTIGINVEALEEICETFVIESSTINNVETLIEKLQSPQAKDREHAATVIVHMADNPSFIKSLLDINAFRIAAPLLVDKNVGVRHAIAGALRNLCVFGGPEVCTEMVAQEVMTPLVALFNQYNSCWSPKNQKDKIDSKTEIFYEACNLLSCLCESSDVALSIFNEARIVSVLLPCLNVDVFGLKIPIVVAQCIQVVAGHNPEVITQLSQPMIMEQLTMFLSNKSKEPGRIFLGVLSADIMLSVHSGKIDECSSSVFSSMLDIISRALTITFVTEFQVLSEKVCVLETEKENKYRDESDMEEKVTEVENGFQEIEHLLSAKQIALEMLTDICFGDDNDDWEIDSNSDNSDEMAIDCEEVLSTEVKFSLNAPCEVYGFIVNQQLLEKVLSNIVFLPEEVAKKLQKSNEGPNSLKRLHTVRSRALLCINNLVEGLSIEDLGGSSKLFDIWLNVTNLAFKETDIKDVEQLEAAISSARAILRKIAEEKRFSLFHQMSESDIAMMTDLCRQTDMATIKVNVIQTVGTLGCLLGNSEDPNAFKLINIIGSFLMEFCAKNTDLWVMTEALDAIMDVFAEDHLDGIVREISLVEKLRNCFPHYKAKVKLERKSSKKHLPIITTVMTNLRPFIKYKEEHLRK